MQYLKPNNLDVFLRPNSKCEIVAYPKIMLALFLNTAINIQILLKKQLAKLIEKKNEI